MLKNQLKKIHNILKIEVVKRGIEKVESLL